MMLPSTTTSINASHHLQASNSRRIPRKSIEISTSKCVSLLFLLLLALNSTIAIISASSATSLSTSPSSSSNNNNNNNVVTNQTSASQKQTLNSDAPAGSTKTTSSKTTTGNNNNINQQQQVTIVDPQQQQSTDLSSMYVQIPIAEPGDTGLPDGVQQTSDDSDNSQTSTSGGDKKGSSSWTGPWPKKFQIGYIKQSDLHQVLIESLKNDPFVALGGGGSPSQSPRTTGSSPSASTQAPTGPATSPVAATKAATKSAPQSTSSDSSSLMSPVSNGGQGIKSPQWPSSNTYAAPAIQVHSQRLQHPQQQQQQQQVTKNTYHPHRQQNFQHGQNMVHQSAFNQQMQRYQQQQQQQQMANFNHMPRQQHHQNQHQQKLISMTGNPDYLQQQVQQQQFQFANYPSGMFKNQPIYTTINNYPQQQEQPDPNSMQLLLNPQQQQQQIQFPAAPIAPASNFVSTTQSRQQPQKSGEYYSSWKPVTSDDKPQEQQQQQVMGAGKTSSQQGQAQADYQALNDDFEDGFSSPSKDGSTSTGAMNRHPVLNNYLGSSNTNNNKASEQSSAKLSPTMKMKQQQSRGEQEGPTNSAVQPTQGAATKGSNTEPLSSGGTKSGVSPATGGQSTKGGSDSTTNLSTGRRRASNNSGPGSPTAASSTTSTTTSTTTTTSASGSTNDPLQQTTTLSTPTADDDGASNSTTLAPPATTSTGSTMIMSTTTIDTDTAEPDSEVIESETTDSSLTSGSTTTTTTTTTTSSTQATAAGDSRESEVVTQSNVQQQQLTGTAKLPSLSQAGNDDSTQASSREETTPSSGLVSDSSSTSGSVSQAASSKAGAEIEDNSSRGEDRRDRKGDSMSDEALLAAVKNGADIGKMQQQRQSMQGSGSSNKRIRSSSERLQTDTQVNPSTSTTTLPSSTASQRRKSTAPNNPGNKLITKRPSATSGARSAKQVSAAVDANATGVKGAPSSRLSATNQTRAASGASKSNKKRLAPGKSAKTSSSSSSGKSTRNIKQQQQQQQRQQSAKLQAGQPVQPVQVQTTQVLSMTAAQAQSTAQTLASLLLSRCLAWNGCAHLLDICTTKQAAVPMPANLQLNQQLDGANSSSDPSTLATGSRRNSTGAGWSVPVGLMSSGLTSLAQSLQADRVLRVFPQWRDAVENVVDHDPQTGYTLILPSNEAIDRLPMATIDSWLSNSELLGQIIDNHMIDSAAEQIEVASAAVAGNPMDLKGQSGGRGSRVIRSKGLQVNQHRDRMVTINGKRLVYANQLAPGNGQGLQQQANKLLDIMDTLKQCDKFDGFVTLAEGTGLTQILKQDGPMTVFVPSNEALRKIPDEELEVIKNNSTALKEFLMYHVVNGSYFSQDLRDGQQLSSILDMKPIQVGIRVDGCSRRLVEANTSPMRRPDIVAKNGVIHILDWYLTVRDNEWCDQGNKQAILEGSSSSASASASISSSSGSSDRLQQLASDSSAAYATRMSMPMNHKPASMSNNKLNEASQAQLATGYNEHANNIIVSATPLNNDQLQAARVA